MSEKIELLALWSHTSKNGEAYLSGTLGANKVLVFPNKFKKAENEPDYRVYLVPKDKEVGEKKPPQKEIPF